MRRITAALVLIAALVIAGVLWMVPVTVSVLGTTGTCGPAIFTAVAPASSYGSSSLDQELAPECRSQGLSLSIIGAIIGAGGVAASLVLWRMYATRWPTAARGLQAELMRLHPRNQSGVCPSCGTQWPCLSARAVLASGPAVQP